MEREKTRILVTGAGGQLGNELRVCAELGVNEAQFCFCDSNNLDITQLGSIRKAFDAFAPDLVVNCAAFTAVDKAESDTLTAYRVNAEAVGLLAAEVEKRGAAMIQISTDYVFNGNKRTPYLETDIASPLGSYGATKLQGESEMRRAGCRGVIIRTGWLYSSFGKNFVKTILSKAATTDSLNVVADRWGTPTYAADLARVICDISQRVSESGVKGDVFHYSALGETSWWEFADTIVRMAKIDCRVRPIASTEYKTEARRPEYSVLDNNKIHIRFGVEPSDWEQALSRALPLIIKSLN